MTSSCTSSSSSRCFFLRHILPIHNLTINSNNLFVNFLWTLPFALRNLWRNAPRIWRDFGSALPFQSRLTQTKLVLPLSNKHGSQVKDQGRRQCCHNKHNNLRIGLYVMYLYFPHTIRIKHRPLCCHRTSLQAVAACCHVTLAASLYVQTGFLLRHYWR